MNTTEDIWSRYHSNLLAFIRRRVNQKHAAEDILQDIFVRVHSSIGALEHENKLESWLYQITRNALADYYRSQRPQDQLPEWLAGSETSENDNIRRELSMCLVPMIQQLPDKYRHAVELSELEGRNQSAIAEVEGISLSGAKSRVQRGRSLLKAMLHDCCDLEINARNQVVEYDNKGNDCKFC